MVTREATRMHSKLAIVVAVTSDWGIGNNGMLPWHPKRLALDMTFLKFVTTNRYELTDEGNVEFLPVPEGVQNAVIMGRKTWDSIPPKFKPMEGRINIVITSDVAKFRETNAGYEHVYAEPNLEAAVMRASQERCNGQIFILGGALVYEEALKHPGLEAVFITRLQKHSSMPCDVIFPGKLLEVKCKKVSNITKQVYDILEPRFPKTASVVLDPDQGQFVTEHGVEYGIDLFIPK